MDEVVYCAKCGGFMEWDRSCQLMSCPPQYAGRCEDCGNRISVICTKVDRVFALDKSE